MHASRLSPLVASAVVALALLPSTAAVSAPIVYTFEGTLVQASTVDGLDLAGARLVVTTQIDSGTAPTSTSSDANSETARWAVSASASFTNRPNSAPDRTIVYDPNLIVVNFFPPGFGNDQFNLQGATTSFEGVSISMPAFGTDFADQGFLPGTGTPGLPVFEASDIGLLSASPLFQLPTLPRYTLENLNVTSTLIPEPAPGALVAAGLVGLAALRRRPRAPEPGWDAGR